VARISQTETAVLGALSVRPMTGYAVREVIQEVLGHFWSESYGQIYPTLNTLHRDGLLERHPGDRAGSYLYELTPAGRDRLRELLRQPETPVPPRNGLMLRLFFGRTLGPEACRELIEQARATARAQLGVFQAIRAQMAAESAETDHDDEAEHRPYWLLTVSAGEHTARAAIAWADEALAALAEIAP
jgi:DNA-binding PadR family transcriptional regulator